MQSLGQLASIELNHDHGTRTRLSNGLNDWNVWNQFDSYTSWTFEPPLAGERLEQFELL